MSAEEYKEYYLNQYDNESRGTPKQSYLNMFRERIGDYLHSDYVLDYGAGNGDYLEFFTGTKYAVEPSEEMRKTLHAKGIKTDLPPIVFDFIVLRHVAEHFLDPVGELSEVRDLMADDGKMYVAVPNNLSKYRGRGWFIKAHTYYFNPYSLLNLFRIVGLDALSIGWDNEEVWAIVQKCEQRKPILFESLHTEQINTFKHVFKWEESKIYRLKNKLFNLLPCSP